MYMTWNNMRQIGLEPNELEVLASNRSSRRSLCKDAEQEFHSSRLDAI